jgi:hypothetical protein
LRKKEHFYLFNILFSVTTKPPPPPIPSNKASKAPSSASGSNSTTNPVIITTQFPSVKTRAASEPRATNLKPSSSPPVPIKHLTQASLPPPPQPAPIVNGHKKKTTPPRAPSSDRAQSTAHKPVSSSSSIFVPPPALPNTSNVRLDANIEIGRLEMEDLTDKDLNKIYESYVNDLIEEVIQSDFEKPSIPEVILAVITDLTNDDDDTEQQLPPQTSSSSTNNINQIYNFNQDKARSSSPMPYNNNNQTTNGTNGDTDHYYTRVHQAVNNINGLNNHDSVRSTNSSTQSLGLTTAPETTSNYLQVKISSFNSSSYHSNNSKICWTGW